MTNKFTQLKLTPTKNFYLLFFLLNKNQKRKFKKKLSDLLYYNLVEPSGMEFTTKIAVMKKKLQLSLKLISQNKSVIRRLISQNWSVTLTAVAEKKKISTLTLILMNQLTWPLISFLFLK